MTYDFDGKRVAVIGMARSGMAAADVLSRRGAEVTLYDGKREGELDNQIRWAAENNVQVVTNAKTVGPSDIVVVSPGVRRDGGMLQAAENCQVEVWGEIEAAYRISKAPILAVTGTNGKTTTALMLTDMLREGGVRTFAAGNIAAGPLAQPLITAADLANEDDAIVAEISSFQLETIQKFRPRAAAILNITPDHQDRQNWDDYVAAKWRIFENQDEGDTAVLSSTVPSGAEPRHLPDKVIYFDEIERPDWINNLLVPGEHNRLNALAALAMASSFGISTEAAKRAALNFKGVVHRLEFVKDIDGVKYYNNSMCTNNAAFASSLEALPGRKIVIAGGVFKGGDMTPIADAVIANNVWLLLLFGKSARDIADTVRKRCHVETVVLNRMEEAAALAASAALPGDIIILNPGCASFDQFNDFEDRGEQFKAMVDLLERTKHDDDITA